MNCSIYELYQEAYARNNLTIMISDDARHIVEAYDEQHERFDESLGDKRLLKGWYVNLWQDGQIIGLAVVDELRVSTNEGVDA